MRRFLLVLALPFLAFFVAPASAAEEWVMTGFATDITVRLNGTLRVEETIGADFLAERHGIYRYVPYRGHDDRGEAYRLRIKLLSATMDGEPVEVDASRQDGNVVWRIGWPDRTFTGAHDYVLTYEVGGAIRRFDDHDELYWNATGDLWDVPLPIAKAAVALPGGVPTGQVSAACYTGPYGSKERACAIAEAGTGKSFVADNPGDALTVVVGWPKGLVGEDRLGAFLDALSRWWPLILPILTVAYMYRRWRRHGDDPDHPATVVQYDPPEGLTPVEVTTLLAQGSDRRALAATVVDLAARGYLTIGEVEPQGLLAKLRAKDYLFTAVRPRASWEALKPFERELLGHLLQGDAPPQRRMSELKEKFHAHADAFAKGALAQLTAEGYFENNPHAVKMSHIGVGAGTLVLGGFLFMAAPVLGACLFVSGVVIAGFGWFMPRWTAKGHAAAGHALGYRAFISQVEKHRAPWMETQNVFERTLPYALVFGLGGKWVKAFSGLLTRPPDWYHGASMAAWNPAHFAGDLDKWSNDFNAIAVSNPSSSGSGSGFGGGFSGGGFGGGGGGSW